MKKERFPGNLIRSLVNFNFTWFRMGVIRNEREYKSGRGENILASGVLITEKYKGIYYLTGKVLFDTQVIVTGQVDGKKHPGLKILSRNAKEDDVRTFLQDAAQAKEPADYQNIDAVLQVSVSENEELFQKDKRGRQNVPGFKGTNER